jgi:molybdopterin converting factor subunit 1
MTLTVKLFARARDLLNSDTALVQVPELTTVGQFRKALIEQHPLLAPLGESLHVAVGNDYASDDTVLSPHDELACFPPVSGG